MELPVTIDARKKRNSLFFDGKFIIVRESVRGEEKNIFTESLIFSAQRCMFHRSQNAMRNKIKRKKLAHYKIICFFYVAHFFQIKKIISFLFAFIVSFFLLNFESMFFPSNDSILNIRIFIGHFGNYKMRAMNFEKNEI